MNESYLSLGYPVIVEQDEWINMFWSYYGTSKYRYVYSNTPNEAIEIMKGREITPFAMHFCEAGDTVILNILIL